MNEQAPIEMLPPAFGRTSIFRPLWWILQGIIVGIWRALITFVGIWQIFHILFTGRRHTWSVEFSRKFVNHLKLWIEYTTWVIDKRPEIIEY